MRKTFEKLEVEELYQILDLRSKVFIMEQTCLYQDIDGLDRMSIHYMLKKDGLLVSYLRLMPPGLRFLEHTLSRIVVDPTHRHQGYATKLIKKAMQDIKGLPIRISGQAYLKDYYESLGFSIVKGTYLEDGIPHYEMFTKNE
ncbi:MAG: GNAT family N-acetyltransferase [Acholeplasmataceae bacterium]|nr:GNAT family N-acetyltransferase [Acholeplasmataceae bacterium]